MIASEHCVRHSFVRRSCFESNESRTKTLFGDPPTVYSTDVAWLSWQKQSAKNRSTQAASHFSIETIPFSDDSNTKSYFIIKFAWSSSSLAPICVTTPVKQVRLIDINDLQAKREMRDSIWFAIDIHAVKFLKRIRRLDIGVRFV